MENNQYPKIFKFTDWTAVWSFIVLFALINILVFLFFKNRIVENKRFHSPASYAEIKNKIELIKKDTNKKIIFLGASAMWGAPGITNAEDTIPLKFANNARDGVSVYNLSFPAARPLDILIMTTLLKDQADLFVIDINSDYFKDDLAQGAKEDRTKYIRVQNLLSANYREIFKENPTVEQCLKNYNLTPPHELFFDISPYIPLVKYKDEINYFLFGKPFPLFFSNIITGVLELFKSGEKQVVWHDIFKPQENLPFNDIKVNQAIVRPLQTSINSCAANALADYVIKKSMPVIFYVSPHSQESTKLQRLQLQYAQNSNFISDLYKGTNFINLDIAQTVPAGDFMDEMHFNPDGHKRISDALYSFIRSIPDFKKLIK